MFEDVGQGFLDDSIGREFYDVREFAQCRRWGPIDLYACGGEGVDKGVQLVQRRGRCGRERGAGTAEYAEENGQFLQHGAAAGADEGQGTLGLVGLGPQDVGRDPGLHVHQGD
ncbi:MAG TPA: hypothetical protein VIQ79_26805, partial [Kribbella sp.]